jgi:c(7)-type cytochrome triheme protein
MSFAPAPSRLGLQADARRRAPLLLLVLALSLATGVTADESSAPSEPGDIKFVRQAAGMDDVSPATFPHWIHRMAYTCYACHDSLYPMKAGATLVTMDQIQAGQSCGACHDGKTAFISNLTTCNRCHR